MRLKKTTRKMLSLGNAVRYNDATPEPQTMPSTDRQAEKILSNVVHDLRQPLGNIEISSYLLHRILHEMDGQACQHLRNIERQIDLASRILSDAAAEMNSLNCQATEGENLAFTKSET